ncbi:MAG TPA: hypothetical protein PLD86_04025 [Vicinamibacteria bacterium]|nr:hypothetical protein [Vicinamibacteria bacterium]
MAAWGFAFRLTTAAVLAAGLGTAAWAHKFYASLAVVEHTAEGRLEVSLRFFPDDLEAALRKSTGRTIAVENTKEFAAAFLPWLDSVFSLSAGKQTTRFKYVGVEVGVETAWVYVEAPWTESLDRSSMKNAILVDLFPEQKNTVNFAEGKRRSSIVFGADQTAADRLLSSRHADEPR